MVTRKAGLLGTLAASLFLPFTAAAQEAKSLKLDAPKNLENIELMYESSRPSMYWQDERYHSYPGTAAAGRSFWDKKSKSLLVAQAAAYGYDIATTEYFFQKCPKEIRCREGNVFINFSEDNRPVMYILTAFYDGVRVWASYKMRKIPEDHPNKFKRFLRKVWFAPMGAAIGEHIYGGTSNLQKLDDLERRKKLLKLQDLNGRPQ